MSSKSVLILFLVPSSPPRRPVHGRQPKLRLFRLPRPWQSRRLLRIGKAIEFAKIPYSSRKLPFRLPEIETALLRLAAVLLGIDERKLIPTGIPSGSVSAWDSPPVLWASQARAHLVVNTASLKKPVQTRSRPTRAWWPDPRPLMLCRVMNSKNDNGHHFADYHNAII